MKKEQTLHIMVQRMGKILPMVQLNLKKDVKQKVREDLKSGKGMNWKVRKVPKESKDRESIGRDSNFWMWDIYISAEELKQLHEKRGR